MDNSAQALKLLKLDHYKTTDPKIKKDLSFAIHFLQKAMAQQKDLLKKEQRKLHQENLDRDAAMRDQLRVIQQKRAKLTATK